MSKEFVFTNAKVVTRTAVIEGSVCVDNGLIVSVDDGASAVGSAEDFAGEWHRNRLSYYRKHHGRMAGIWVKSCTALAWLDHVFAAFGRRLKGEPMEPLYPLCRSFGTFLIS